MELSEQIRTAPVGLLVGILVILPFAAGAVAGLLFNDRTWRRGAVQAVAWVMSAAALLLFAHGAALKGVVSFDPIPVAGIAWSQVILAADIALLAGFVGIGLARRSPLITALAVAQAVPIVYAEFFAPHHGASAPPPAIYIDWLTIAMVMLVSVVGCIVTVYALPYMKEHERHLGLERSRRPRFFLLMFFFLGAMNGLVMSNHLLWMCFFWEVTTLCSYLLIGHDGTPEAVTNAGRALWMNLIGGLAFSAAVALVVQRGACGPYVSEILASTRDDVVRASLLLPMGLLCLAGFTKAAQMPFQNWLLGAMVAPTPVSALLHSSTMVKAGVYLVVRFAPVYHGTALSQIVALSGAFTFVAGAGLAISQTNAKRLLAYSTISNLGLIIACAGLNTPLALAAAVMLIVFHALSKGLLFMATGVVEHSIWSREIEDMQGLVARMSLTTTIMIIGIFSMLMPPFGVLVAKLAAIEASATMPAVLVMLVVGSTLTLVFWTKWMGSLLTADPHAGDVKIEKLHRMYFAPLLLLTAGTIVFSVFVVQILQRLVDPAVKSYYQGVEYIPGIPLANNVLTFPWAPVFGVLLVAVVTPVLFYHMRRGDLRSAYMCGEQVRGAEVAMFRTVGEAKQNLSITSLYFDRVAGEARHVGWTTAVAIVLCATLLLVASR